MQIVHIDTAKRLAMRALANGGRQTKMTTVEWDLAPRCERPRHVEVIGRPPGPKKTSWQFGKLVTSEGRDAYIRSGSLPIFVDLHVKCRGCSRCLKERSAMWKFRAQNEYRQASRTWFGTLTFQPSERYLIVTEARHAEAKQGIDFDTLPDQERFTALCKIAGMRLTRYMKRLRKSTGAPIRYLAVCERHKDGFPHIHMLLHEQDSMSPVRKRALDTWPHGFTRWKLADTIETCGYVAKYLSKEKLARVRASLSYGKQEFSHALSLASQKTCVTPKGANDPLAQPDIRTEQHASRDTRIPSREPTPHDGGPVDPTIKEPIREPKPSGPHAVHLTGLTGMDTANGAAQAVETRQEPNTASGQPRSYVDHVPRCRRYGAKVASSLSCLSRCTSCGGRDVPSPGRGSQ
jgi:hypothetical protein